MTVSIVIPTYNRGPQIAATLDKRVEPNARGS